MEFTERVLSIYAKMRKEIEPQASEYDVRHRIIKYVVEELLGYQGKDYQAEKNRTDIRLLDETHSLVLVVMETKKPTVDISEGKWRSQAFGYADAFTKYIVLTNGMRVKIWDTLKRRGPVVDLDFESIVGIKGRLDRLSPEERAQISAIYELTREALWSEKKYQDFVVPQKIGINTDEGFQKLLDKMAFMMNQLLMGYTLGAFSDYLAGYRKYEAEATKLQEELGKVKGKKELEVRYEKEKMELDSKNQRFVDFYRGYSQWLRLSGREDNEESREVFCKETIYVLLNKILFVRISEDKGLVTKRISNSGIETWRQFAGSLKDSYRDLLEFTYKDISRLYSHLYERSIFDWYAEGDGELNRVLNKVLYILNRFDFREVNRDILGKLYEKYLPREERKRLGEFYTPDEVIDYILDGVGYTPEKEIEGKDLLDPACGSGGFIVKAMNRLTERYRKKGLGPKEIINNVVSHIYGLDIDPFACHIAEMNILFQLLDLYQKAKEKEPDYILPRFNVYQTDSLEPPRQGLEKWQYTNSRIERFLEEKGTIDQVKGRGFDFLVMNPPYIESKRTSTEEKDNYRDYYGTAFGMFDMYVLFVERAIRWLKDNGKLGVICPNMLMKRDYAKLLRGYMLETCSPIQIVDFDDCALFDDAINYTAIYILQKGVRGRTFPFVRARSVPSSVKLFEAVKESMEKGKVSYPQMDYGLMDLSELRVDPDSPWHLVPRGKKPLFEKLKNTPSKLNDICERMYVGLQTGKDGVFFVDKSVIDRHNLEPFLLRKQLKGRDVKKWKIVWNELWVIYPYQVVDGKLKPIVEEEFKQRYPNIWSYLGSRKEALEHRKRDLQKFASGEMLWYELDCPVRPLLFEKQKIVVPELSRSNNFALDSAGLYTNTKLYSLILKKEYESLCLYVLGVLNSKALESYYKEITVPKAQGFYAYKTQFLKQLPIVLPNLNREKHLAEEIKALVKEILSLESQAEALKRIRDDIHMAASGVQLSRLDDYPPITLDIRSNKVIGIRRTNSMIFLNLTDHIECKDDLVARYVEVYLRPKEKELRDVKDLRAEVCRIPIPKQREHLQKIMDQYESAQKELEEIPEKISALEREIDKIVYKLYGLTEEDIKVIEESLTTRT